MKNRILSCVLAVLMVVSMLTVLAVNASAEATGVTLTVGTTYAVPGTTAYVDVYVSATTLPAEYLGLRNWQMTFAGAQVAEKAEFTFDVTAGDPAAFVNLTKNEAGCSSDTGKYVAGAATVLARGGAKIMTAAFEVPAEATEDIEISITAATIKFEDEDYALYEEAATLVAGKIVLVDALDGVQAAVAGEGADVVLAPVVDNVVVSKMTKAGKLSGEFGLLTVPATITSVAAVAVSGATYEAVNLKGTAYNSATVAPFVEAASVVYYAKRANGTDTTFGALTDYIANESDNEPELKNILNVVDGALIADNNVTFTGVIAAEDLDFDTVTLVADFDEGANVKEVAFDCVYKTVTGIASVDAAVATAQGIEAVDGAYLASMTVTGVPSGSYSVKVTLYGTTPDANGNLIWVCSDTATVDVVVA